MWEMISGMMPRQRRRNGGVGTVTAMVIGAGVGIAAWEMMRRNNIVGGGGGGDSLDGMQKMANDMMNAITD